MVLFELPLNTSSVIYTIRSQAINIMRPLTIVSTLLSASLPFGALSAPSQQCKPLPGTPNWPSQDAWAKLNDTIEGHLISPPAPGAVCHPNNDLYNNETCAQLQKDWTSSAWHAANPITSDYNDDTCIPDPDTNCTRDGYPAYTVNATKHEHVAAAVKFAADTGVRLVIKGTGHDFPGRSAGRGSLSIHTHYLRGIDVQHSDPRAVKHGGSASVKIAAGMRMGELYEQMADENLTISAGADLNVGIGGWTGGAGHSPVSSLYGLGADNVLEMEVVTADGEIRTINETADTDLFRAMRGGGPSTYAVLLSVTMMAYPSVNLSSYIFFYNTTAVSASFWNMTGLFHSHLPRISDDGGMGYYFTLPNISILADGTSMQLPVNVSTVPPSQHGLIFGMFLFNSTPEAATEVMAPLEKALRDLSGGDNPDHLDPILASGIVLPPTLPFSRNWLGGIPQSVGTTGTRLGSWLLGSKGLTNSSLGDLATAFAAASEFGPTPQLGHLVAGPGVHRFALPESDPNHRVLPGGDNGVNPAWRTAYTHVVLPAGWAPGATTGPEAKDTATSSLQKRVDALRKLEPDSGAYMNEADPTNPEWQGDYFGQKDTSDNYEKLLAVKNKWDAQGVFWCRTCVGNDEWEWRDADGVAQGQGVGQDVGLLCRKKE